LLSTGQELTPENLGAAPDDPEISHSSPPHPIHAERAGSDTRQIQEQETVEYGSIASVLYRQGSASRMHLEVRNGHLSAQNECDGSCKKAYHDERAADQLQHASKPWFRAEVSRRSVSAHPPERAQQFLCTVAREQKSGNHAQHEEQIRWI
jgi:hypothetical protein